MPTIHSSEDPIKDGLRKLNPANLDRITGLRIAKNFAKVGKSFVGFEGKDENGKYFQLRLDYDYEKKVHVKVTINDNEKYEYVAKTENYTWYIQVLKNINEHYCEITRDAQGEWETAGKEKDLQCIEGMKKFKRQQI